jgi:hypothetical protein
LKKIEFIKDEFQPWAMHALKLGFTDFISPEDGFLFELSKKSKWSNANSSGIYAWITGNGQSYVGQAVNVRNRLRQHWKNYRNIAYAAFRAVNTNDLDAIERQLIRKMEEHFPSSTLNIKFAASSVKVVPFDLIVTSEICDSFLRGEPTQYSNDWQNWPLLENKKVRNFERFERTRFSKNVTDALGIFINRCLPDAPATEVKFWSASLLYPNATICRVNAGQQEVFTVWDDGTHLHARVLASSQLSDDFEFPLYETESYANFLRLEHFQLWLTKERAIEIRKLVVWLMRHTVPLNSGSHCPQLVRASVGH